MKTVEINIGGSNITNPVGYKTEPKIVNNKVVITKWEEI